MIIAKFSGGNRLRNKNIPLNNYNSNNHKNVIYIGGKIESNNNNNNNNNFAMYNYRLEIDNYVIHDAEIVYNKANIRKEQSEALLKLESICKFIDEMEQCRINIDKWYSLEYILNKLGIEYYKNSYN